MHVERRHQPEMDPAEDDSDDEDRRTIFCANLHEKTTEELLYELFIQAGPVESVRIVKDKDGRQKTFGFVTYVHACSVWYALELFEGVTLFYQRLVLKPKQQNSAKSFTSNIVRSYMNPVSKSFQIQGNSRRKDEKNSGPDEVPQSKSQQFKNNLNTEVLSRLGAGFLLGNGRQRNGPRSTEDDNPGRRTVRDNKPYVQSNPFKRPEANKVGERNRGYGNRPLKHWKR